jgi:hypothetical protein
MPSKAAQLIAFFGVLLISVALHRYVYKNLKRVLLRDYPKMGVQLAKWTLVLFIVMDSPFLFLFLKSRIHEDLNTLTRILLYPFSVWQAVMIFWALLLAPQSLWRRSKKSMKLLKRYVKRRKNVEETYEPILEVVTD